MAAIGTGALWAWGVVNSTPREKEMVHGRRPGLGFTSFPPREGRDRVTRT